VPAQIDGRAEEGSAMSAVSARTLATLPTAAESHSGAAKSAQRALDVLVLLSRRLRPLPTMVIARELGIPKSSTHHLMNTMRDRGFVTYFEADHAWGLGTIVFDIGSSYLRSAPLQRLGRPILEQLTDSLGETTHLAMLHGADVVYIDKELAGPHAPQLITEVGLRLPAHLTAVGRAILGSLPGAQVRAIFAHQALVRRTHHGPRSLKNLLGELGEVRAAGYAVEHEMVTPGISCVAAPIFSSEGMPVAALGVTMATTRCGEARVQQLVGELVAAARRLSSAIGSPAARCSRGRRAA
jgi:IclR family transcriptional regulator, acetate operon repressor